MVVLFRVVEICGFDVRSLVVDEVFEFVDFEVRDVMFRFCDGNVVFKDSWLEDCVLLKIDFVVDFSEIDFWVKVDLVVIGDVLGMSVVIINFVWKLEVWFLIVFGVILEVIFGVVRDVMVIISFDVMVDIVLKFVFDDFIIDVELIFDNCIVGKNWDDGVILIDE